MSGQRVSEQNKRKKQNTGISVFEDRRNFDSKLGFHSGVPNYCNISKHIR